MKSSIKILLGVIVALLIVGGAFALNSMNNGPDIQKDNSSTDVGRGDNMTSSNNTNASLDNDSDIVSEEIKFNAQNGEGYYREVTYRDGGFRQFDVETGELIGSSYSSDQSKLPSLE